MYMFSADSAMHLWPKALGENDQSKGHCGLRAGNTDQSAGTECQNENIRKVMKNRPDIATIRKWVKICSAIMVVITLRVWENVQTQRFERQLKGLRAETDRLTYENGRLQLQVHQFEAPSNLE